MKVTFVYYRVTVEKRVLYCLIGGDRVQPDPTIGATPRHLLYSTVR